MDSVHLHLLINHVPVLATIFSMFVLLWGMIRSEKSYYRLAMVGFIVAALFSIVALQSGEGAEDHEETAKLTNWIALLTGLVSAGGLVIQKYKPKITKRYAGALLVLALISSGTFAYTAYLGGQIRHTEIRSGNAAVQPDTGESREASGIEDDDGR